MLASSEIPSDPVGDPVGLHRGESTQGPAAKHALGKLSGKATWRPQPPQDSQLKGGCDPGSGCPLLCVAGEKVARQEQGPGGCVSAVGAGLRNPCLEATYWMV